VGFCCAFERTYPTPRKYDNALYHISQALVVQTISLAVLRLIRILIGDLDEKKTTGEHEDDKNSPEEKTAQNLITPNGGELFLPIFFLYDPPFFLGKGFVKLVEEVHDFNLP
jgi:hypothetical protein